MIVIDKEEKVAINFDCFSKMCVSTIKGSPVLKIIADDHTFVYEAAREVCEKLFDRIIDAYVFGTCSVFDIRKEEQRHDTRKEG